MTAIATRARLLALAALGALVLASSCGSRLSDKERTDVISALSRARSGTTTGPATGPSSSGPEVTGDETTTEGSDGAGGPAANDEGGGAPQAQGGSGGEKTCSKATKATDTGVTADKVTVATLADISGVQPGLFQSAHQAVRAAAAYINSKGGICGRMIDPLLLDSKTDSGGNRAAMLDACSKSFVVAGSMSAFDDGSAAPGEACGIPDITAITTNAAKYKSTNTYPVFPGAAGVVGTTPAKYIKQRYPDVIKKAAVMWLNQAVTKNNAAERKKAWEAEGFEFIYEAEAQVLEANYTRFVQEMQSRGVQYVTMVSDFQSIVRLQRAMRQQGYVPKVRGWDSVAYDGEYLSEKDVVEGSLVFLNTALFEEAGSNAEMKLYTEWLQRASPGATPDYFGIHAWSAYRLFQDIATKIGPDLTREKVMAALKATDEWNGQGIHVPHKIGAKMPSTCNLYVQAKAGKFVRLAPASGFDCSGRIVKTR